MQTQANIPESGANGQGAGATPSANATADETPSGLSREFYSFLADVEDQIKETTSLSGEELARSKVKFSERVAAAKESVEAMGGTIDHSARQTATVTNDSVHEQPWKVLGVGAAVAFLLGLVLARRG